MSHQANCGREQLQEGQQPGRPLKGGSDRGGFPGRWVLHASQQPTSSVVVVGNLLDQLNDGPPQTIMINSRECLQQAIGMWPGELVKNQLLVGVRHLVTALEQGRDRNIQKRCDLQQSPAANPISPLLVFLDLLERQTEFIRKLCLSELLLQTINPDIAANHLVDRVGPFASQHKPSPPELRKPQDTIPGARTLTGGHVTP